MKKLPYRKLCALLACIGSIGLSYADSDSPVYINLNTGAAKLYNFPSGEWTGNINAGYEFNSALALETGYSLFAGSQFGVTTATSVFDVAVKGTIPFNDVFALYGRAGLGFGMNSWSGTLVADGNCILCNSSIQNNYGLALAAIGGSFNLSKNWSLRLEDTAYIPFVNTTTGTMMAITGGVQYNF